MSFVKYNNTTLVAPVDGAYVSVTEFGAYGDGTHDDSDAIQAALDAKRSTGGTIYFPVGIYIVTKTILFYSNQTLLFEQGATIMQGAAIDNLMMSYCSSSTVQYSGTHDCVIDGAIFDGGSYTTNNTLVGTVHANNIIIRNCSFIHAYGSWHNLEINSSNNVKIINCFFNGYRKTGQNGCLIQLDALTGSATWPWPDNIGVIDNTPANCIDISGCTFFNSSLAPAIGNHSSTPSTNILIHGNVFRGITSTRGVISFGAAENVRVYDNILDQSGAYIGAVPAETTLEVYQMDDYEMLSNLMLYGKHDITASDIELGSWTYSKKGTNAARLRSKKLYKVKPGMKISVINPTFKVFIGTLGSASANSYSSGGSGWNAVSSTGMSYTIPNNTKYINLIFETADGTDAALANYDCTIGVAMPS